MSAADPSYQSKVHGQGPDVLAVESGGTIEVKTGGALIVAGVTIDADTLAMDGVTASADELNLNDGAIAGTSVASKTLALGANKETDVLALPVSGLKIGAGAGTAVSATAAELNTVAGVVAGAASASKAVVLDASRRVSGVLTPSTARTATATGATTGTIADDGGFDEHIVVTSDDANKIIILPTPVVGKKITIDVGATGFELRSSTPTTIAINGGTGAAAESAIPANSTLFLVCVTTTAWKGFFMDADGDLAKIEAAAT